ncbi:MAG: hypothetical protein E4G90_09915 [Gemmatimonadales bacterium]|nr:MAG: hypothetical protein E4G90_09915 [Gemmatimonadales bacterium]
MAYPKGKPRPEGSGRQSGTPNKATTSARDAIARLVNGNAEKLQGWLDEIAAKDPEKAWKCLMDVVEYHIPKLSRSELTGPDGGPLQVNIIDPTRRGPPV